jgi:hypothetical protein
MHQSKRVPELMQHFFHCAFPQHRFFPGQAVKLLMQAAKRHYGDRTVKLRLAKQKTQHRDGEIHVRNAQNAHRILGCGLSQHLHNLDRLILPTLGIVGARWNC